MCAEMLSLLRTPAEQLKSTLKAVVKRMRGERPVAGAGAPGSGAPHILFMTAFPFGFSRSPGPFFLLCNAQPEVKYCRDTSEEIRFFGEGASVLPLLLILSAARIFSAERKKKRRCSIPYISGRGVLVWGGVRNLPESPAFRNPPSNLSTIGATARLIVNFCQFLAHGGVRYVKKWR